MKQMTLAEAKETLKNDKVFLNRNGFNVSAYGKYQPNMTFVISDEFPIGKNGEPQNPIQYRKFRDLTDNMNIDFDGNADVLFGNFRISQTGKPVLELENATDAHDVLIRVGWGGAFSHTRGAEEYYIQQVQPTWFAKRSSNGGGEGYDYWVVPVGFVAGREDRNVSEILKQFQKQINDEHEKAETAYAEKVRAKEESRVNKENVLSQVRPLVDEIQRYNPKFHWDEQDDGVVYGREEEDKWSWRTALYDENLFSVVQSALQETIEDAEKEKKIQDDRKEYLPKFQSIIHDLRLDNKDFQVFDFYIESKLNTRREDYRLNQEGYAEFVDDMHQYQEKQHQAMLETAHKESELAYEGKLHDARDAGYPGYKHWHRVGGATSLANAWVVSANGNIRPPDYNILENPNHERWVNWIEVADGWQGYNQLLPGDMIVLYEKKCTADPYHLSIEWCDGDPSEDQLSMIPELVQPLLDSGFDVVDKDSQKVTDVTAWLTDAVKERTSFCLDQIAANKASLQIEAPHL